MSVLKLPYVFLGSAPIGPIALEALNHAQYPPVAVIDDPRMTTDELVDQILAAKPTFLLVVGFGAILKRDVLDTVAGQVLNIHPSMLPLYRGPAPVVQALLDGVRETGVSLMEIDTKMDHGPVLAQAAYPLRGNETPAELYEVLTKTGVQLFLENIDDYLEEKLDLLPQDESEASVTNMVNKEDARLSFSLPARTLERMTRAYQGWPRAYVELDGKRLIIDTAHLEVKAFIPDQVQPEGGKTMPFTDFCRGRRHTPNEVLEDIARQNP